MLADSICSRETHGLASLAEKLPAFWRARCGTQDTILDAVKESFYLISWEF